MASLAPSRKKRRAPPPPPPAYATVVLKEKEVKQVDEREERKEVEEEKKRLEKEERMRREESEERRKESSWEIEGQEIPVQVIQEPDKSEQSKEDGADIIKEVFEVTHDAVMITDIETQDTRRDDEKEEFKEKKKKKKKDKDRDQSVGEGGEERKRKKKKHKDKHREESEGREERRKHKHHHRRRDEGGEVEETEENIEKKEKDIGKSSDREDMPNLGMDVMRRDISDEKKDIEIKYLDEGRSGGRAEEVGVLQLEQADDAVGTDVPAKERVEQNPTLIAAPPNLSDSPGIEKRPEHNLDESATNSVEKSEETLVNPMQSIDSDMLANHTEAFEEKIASSQMDLEEEEEEEDGEARRKEEAERRRKRSERRRSKKEERKERVDEPIAKELPSFRGARAGHAPSVKEGERENSMAVDDTDDSDDSLVNSDDELVDLFLSHKERIEAKNARQAKQLGPADGGLSTGPANQDLEAEVKITGKQREEERKEEIRREQRKGRGRDVQQQQQQGSESVRKALTQLNLGGDDPPAYKREWKAVELDIVDEDIGLPSLSSTRSNSVTEVSSDEEGRRAVIEHNLFAMKELEKEVERQRSQPVNQALDEAFAKISLTGQHDSYVTVGNSQVVERQDRESPEPEIICETKNFHVRKTARDFDFSDTEDNSLSSQQSSLARGGEGSPDAVRHRQPREAPNVTRAGGEAPSPDSGIHDYAADQCASPVSSLGLCREEEAAAGPSTPDSGLELHGSVSEVTSSSGADVCLQDVAEEEEEEEEEEGERQQQAAIERVELPRRHTGKVLFSMASYNERGPSLVPTPAPRDVARTESYRRVSTQLNSNLAAGVERAKEAERREREEHERKAREEREKRNLAEEEEQRKREKKEQQQKEADQRRMKEVEERKWREEREQRRQRAEEEDRQRLVAQQRRQREKEEEERRLAEEVEARYRKKEGEGVIRASSLGSSATFRSRIIEEFECRRGIVIVGGGMQEQGAGARMAGAPPRHSAQSTATGQDKRAEAGGQQETRSLDRREMPSWGGQFSSLQRAPDSGVSEAREPLSLNTSRGRGPPSISMQVWGEEPRVGGVVVKEDRDTALGRRVSQPAATEEVVTSGGSTQSTGGQSKHRLQHQQQQQQQASAAQPKAIEIRQRSGEVVESRMMENPRAAVVSAAKNSRGGDGDTVWGARIKVSSEIFLPPPNSLSVQKPTSYGRGFVGALANGFEQSVEGEGAATRQPFYFGMSPPDKEEMPSLPTAVGKVHHNETLSQPFRTAPRHRKKENKESGGVREVKIVPVKQQPTTVDKTEIVIENNNINFSSKSNNNNSSVANMNTVRKSASRMAVPPREQAQDELSRAFQSQLAAAKLKLRTSGPGEEEEGAPPPPPPPVLPPVALVKAPSPPAPPSKPQWEKRVSTLPKGPMVNPRDELMRAIREKAGKPGRSLPAM